tara:strand:- start:2472 stop:2885 length:414 start_codon:yes stop_codon:yes gene_type:complete
MIVYEQKVYWGEMDAFNHVNNTIYFRYFENARLLYFEESGILEMMQKSQTGPIMAQADCQFIKAVKYPDYIKVKAFVSVIKNTSFKMEYELFSTKQNCLAAKGSSVIVMIDYNTGKKVSIPKNILESIERLDTPTYE